MKDHSDRELKSHLFKNSVEVNHKMIKLHEFKTIGKGYNSSKFRHNLADLLQIEEKGSLYTQKASVQLKLFN